jgi:hypothetical protein
VRRRQVQGQRQHRLPRAGVSTTRAAAVRCRAACNVSRAVVLWCSEARPGDYIEFTNRCGMMYTPVKGCVARPCRVASCRVIPPRRVRC